MSTASRVQSSAAGLALMLAATAALAQKTTPAQPPPADPRAASSASPPPAAAPPRPPVADGMRRWSEEFSRVTERVGPSVVQIDVFTRDENAAVMGAFSGGLSQDATGRQSKGSGVVLTRDGAILTNNLLIDGALSIHVRVSDGRILTAKLVGRDPATDLAVLRVDAVDLVPARFADSDASRVGEWVLAVGWQLGAGKTMTAGVLSALGRGSLGANQLEDYLQTDASINAGNAGGPLVNLDADVVGINTTVVGRGQGMGIAVPANMARRVASQLMSKGRVERPYIGMGVQDITPALAEVMGARAGEGALVNAVAADGPGAKGNLKAGDVIIRVGEKRLRGAQDFIREVLTQEVGAAVKLEVLRRGKRYASSVVLGAQKESAPLPIPAQQVAPPDKLMGLALQEVSTQKAQPSEMPVSKSCIIASVGLGSAAERAGLRAGDVIVEADGVQDPTAEQVLSAAADGKLVVRVRRQDALFYAAMKN